MRFIDKLLLKLKSKNIAIPVKLGQLLSNVSYSCRPGIGRTYKSQMKDLQKFECFSDKIKEEYLYSKFFKVFEFAYHNVPFYSDLYKAHGINPSMIKCYDDIVKVPIITKDDLIKVSIENRSSKSEDKRLVVNTGGSSGKTLSFYLDPNRLGNEWAHIHYIWKKMGYKPNMLKLSFDGRANSIHPIQYDGLRHSLRFNIYEDPNIVAEFLTKFIKKTPVYYLHGYPSAIYNFASYCKDHNPTLLALMKKNLKGAFLTSEFPSPHYRETIESVFNIPTQSFYGHTETCVMAYESERFKFKVLQTYGLAEAVKIDNSEHLVGTNFFNFQSPLIRYDTSDIVSNVQYDQKILRNFEIKVGREGDFILDDNQNRIPLTGLIYGRHHELFNHAKHLQVMQDMPGHATILIVPNDLVLTAENAKTFFDNSKVLIKFTFKLINEPILTKGGKVNLLIKNI